MSKRIRVKNLEEFCIEAMIQSGLSQQDAELSARVFVTTDTWGTFTHGTRQIRGLMKNARRGRLVADAKEQIIAEGPSWAIIDANDGMPPAISCRAVEVAVSKARTTGMAYVGVRRSSHYGAAGFYANMIAENGMFGMSYVFLMHVFAEEVLDVGAEQLGLLMGAAGLGALTGIVIAANARQFPHKGKLLLAGAAVHGVCLIMFTLVSEAGHYRLSMATLLVTDLFMSVHLMMVMPTLQTIYGAR